LEYFNFQTKYDIILKNSYFYHLEITFKFNTMKSILSTILLLVIFTVGSMALPSTGRAPIGTRTPINGALGNPVTDFAVLSDLYADYFVTVPSSTFSTLNPLFSSSGYGFFAGDRGPNGRYFVADYFSGGLYEVNLSNRTLVRIATIAGITAGQSITSMTYDNRLGIMYFGTTDLTASWLYTLNLSTGVASPIGAITNCPGLIDFAISPTGHLYAVDMTGDNFLEINTSTAAGTIIGAVGFDVSWAQDLDFNDNSGELFWASCQYPSGLCEIRKINTANGTSTVLVASTDEFDALAIGNTAPVPVNIFVIISLFVLLGSVAVIRFFWK
jgi:hypothetical protein